MCIDIYYGKKSIHVSSLKKTFPVGTYYEFYERGGNKYVRVSGKEYEQTFEFDVALKSGMIVSEVVESVPVEAVKDKCKLYEVVKSNEDAMDKVLMIKGDGLSDTEKTSGGLEIIKEEVETEVRGMKVVSQTPKKERVIFQDGIKITMDTGNITEQSSIMNQEEIGTVVKHIGHSATDVIQEPSAKDSSLKASVSVKAKINEEAALKKAAERKAAVAKSAATIAEDGNDGVKEAKATASTGKSKAKPKAKAKAKAKSTSKTAADAV